MRDKDKIKEKIEILLDNRQIFLIFLASSVILALVFSLGVVVGKRMRTQPTDQDPPDTLALLDRFGKEEAHKDDFTFHETLMPGKKPDAGAPPAASPDGGPAAVAAKKPDVLAPLDQPVAEAKPAKEQPKQPAADKPADKPAKDEAQEEGAGKYTLQLSSFQDRAEALAYVKTLADTGMKPYIIAANVPDRGVWYRVRLGSFDSWDAALEAKKKFERSHSVIAYVARR